jgi:hypothetical protein
MGCETEEDSARAMEATNTRKHEPRDGTNGNVLLDTAPVMLERKGGAMRVGAEPRGQEPELGEGGRLGSRRGGGARRGRHGSRPQCRGDKSVMRNEK